MLGCYEGQIGCVAMTQAVEQRVGDSGYLVRTRSTMDRASLKRRDLFLQNLGRTVGDFCSQIGVPDMPWAELKLRLGEEGWQTSVIYTAHMHEHLEAAGDEFAAAPWKLMTISLCPSRRGTDASPDQLAWLDQLIEEAQRHCARIARTRQAG